MQQVMMTVGIQASGKSTWAKKWVLESPIDRKRVNRDELRVMLDAGVWSPDNEKYIIKTRDQLVLAALRAKKSIVVDDTNLRADNFTKMCDMIKGAGLSAIVIEKPFEVELEEAIRRDVARAEKGLPAVGEKVIRDTWKKYIGKNGKLRDPRSQVVSPITSSGIPPEHVPGAPDAFICDLDGTLAHMGDRSPFDASRCDELDSPNEPVIATVKALFAAGMKVIFMSGREDKDREATSRFIAKHVLVPNPMFSKDVMETQDSVVIPHVLFMRATADQRNDAIIKRELFDNHIRGKYNVKLALDDRDRVVLAWRNDICIPCFQVQPGAF